MNRKLMTKMGAKMGEDCVSRHHFVAHFLSMLPEGGLECEVALGQLQQCADLVKKPGKVPVEVGQEALFSEMDVNKDGVIDADELKIALDEGLIAKGNKGEPLKNPRSNPNPKGPNIQTEVERLVEQLEGALLVKEAEALKQLAPTAQAYNDLALQLRTMYVPTKALTFFEQQKALALRQRPKRVSPQVIQVATAVAACLHDLSNQV
eukprot:TRINITY_DN36991_c0_g1_i1.p2 TRINITY_DN36991_c0_g1~~TRINITY_DN36991_c0_g1_i1.p2  ORF type:complete len:207 (-),score=66.91 TRINITY_DN36991_c0_g1_i1:348-968(-)